MSASLKTPLTDEELGRVRAVLKLPDDTGTCRVAFGSIVQLSLYAQGAAEDVTLASQAMRGRLLATLDEVRSKLAALQYVVRAMLEDGACPLHSGPADHEGLRKEDPELGQCALGEECPAYIAWNLATK